MKRIAKETIGILAGSVLASVLFSLPAFAQVLNPGDTLSQGEAIRSANDEYELILQDDGNLVLYDLGRKRRVLWSTRTQGRAVRRATMQKDGNFVLYGYDRKPVWDTGTQGYAAYLVVQNDGNVVIYYRTNRGNPTPAWASGSGPR